MFRSLLGHLGACLAVGGTVCAGAAGDGEKNGSGPTDGSSVKAPWSMMLPRGSVSVVTSWAEKLFSATKVIWAKPVSRPTLSPSRNTSSVTTS